MQSYLTHDRSQNSNPRTSDSILKQRRQVTLPYSREHFIMNLWDASFPCSRHACPASYSGSYLNNWFQNLESQSCEFHAYQQVEERFFSRARSTHGSGECMFYELGIHENTADCQQGNFPCDKGEGWLGLAFVGVHETQNFLMSFFFYNLSLPTVVAHFGSFFFSLHQGCKCLWHCG